jgi:hypothetical protein
LVTLSSTSFQHENKEWGKTVFSLKDSKPTRLPIVDVAVKGQML